MCKILTIDKKVKLKKSTDKKFLNQKLISYCIKNVLCDFNNINNISHHPDQLHIDDKSKLCEQTLCELSSKREKSRIAAKKRRNQENENLSELYISLPVATHSKLLSCYDNQFIGNFEKATIIKISAYVLNLYNSLSDILFDESNGFGKHHFVSLFSQSIFGLFWCDKTSKLIFSSPGLAKLTGLYWCNMIGMPRNSIIVEGGSQDCSNMIFLRFMMGALKDRGIFTVNPQKSDSSQQSSDIKSEKISFTNNQSKRDYIGKLPCIVWCSEKLPNGISFNLIQPLIVKSQTLPERMKTDQSHNSFPFRLPISNKFYRTDKRCVSYQFISYHYLDSLATISVSGDFLTSLGYTEEDFSTSNLLSFFHFNDIVQVTKDINEILSGEKKIQMGMARLCTPQIDVYRWCRYILQINSIKEISESNFRSYRSGVNQGESYSQNFVRILDALNNDQNSDKKLENDCQNSWLEVAFSLCHFYHEKSSEYGSTMEKTVKNLNPGCIEASQDNVSNIRHTPLNYFEECRWFDIHSASLCVPANFVDKQDMIFDETEILCRPKDYPVQESILLKELRRPIGYYCA